MLRMFYTFHNNFQTDVEFLNLIFLQLFTILICTIFGQITESATNNLVRDTQRVLFYQHASTFIASALLQTDVTM